MNDNTFLWLLCPTLKSTINKSYDVMDLLEQQMEDSLKTLTVEIKSYLKFCLWKPKKQQIVTHTDFQV